jgi:hypothetical protein
VSDRVPTANHIQKEKRSDKNPAQHGQPQHIGSWPFLCQGGDKVGFYDRFCLVFITKGKYKEVRTLESLVDLRCYHWQLQKAF